MYNVSLEKYSIGICDSFAYENVVQLCTLKKAKKLVIEIAPVWNKSNLEHTSFIQHQLITGKHYHILGYY